MTLPFNPQQGPIIISVEVTGPSGIAVLRLVLDTGATNTLISVAPLVALGYDPALAPQRVQVTTASGVEFVPLLSLLKFTALGQDRTNFPVLCHTLPPSSSVDGLLGLNFLRGHVLTIDFQSGQVSLA